MSAEVNWDLIVHRLDTIVKSQDEFKIKLDDIDEKLSKMETIQLNIDNLKDWKKSVESVLPVSDMKSLYEWKGKLDEVVSPTQLKEHIDDIGRLKTFKTKATTIWIVVQSIIFLLLFLNEMLGIFKKP